MKPRLLDLFCGAGGAATGYHRAGFDVTGVDVAPQPHYPFDFVQADAMTFPLDGFDVVHASPPCQAYSVSTADRSGHPDLYAGVRDRLVENGRPWIIENVPGAPYLTGVVLCGGMFDLEVRRHRNFETSFLTLVPPHRCPVKPWAVTGHANGRGRETTKHRDPPTDMGPTLMGCEWMSWNECVQAVPPAYTEFVGEQLMQVCVVTNLEEL